jgi:trigger factor
MQTTIENLSALERRLTMAVPTAEIEKQVDERLKRIARTVKMSGFRPGKVPMKLVAQQYGPQVRSEVVGDAVERAFSDAVRGQNLRVAGYPKVEPKEGADTANLEFTATFEIYPEVALGDLTAATIERPTLEVTDAEVDRTLDVLRKQRATFEDADRAAATGDRVTIDFVGRIDGTEFPGGKGEDFPVVLGEGRMLGDFETGVAGMKAGETRKVPVKFPDDYHGQDVAGKTAEFDITVKKVEAPKLPGIDAEFAKTLGIPDGDLGKMRAEVRANVEREVKKRLGTDLKNKVMQALLDSTKPELPRSLIDMEIQRLVQNARADLEARGMKMENLPIDPMLFEEQAKRRVALGLIVGEAVKRNDLAAKPEQVRALVEEQAQSYEQPTEVVKWFYSQPERIAEFEGVVVEDNVVNWVLQQAKVVDKPMPFEQLMGNAA